MKTKLLICLVTILLVGLLPGSAGCNKGDDTAAATDDASSAGGWELVYEADNGSQLRDLYFSDDNNGWACGSAGLLLHTPDGGDTWYQVETGTESDLTCFHFFNEKKGVTASLQASIGATVDGGKNWSWQKPELLGKGGYLDVFFIDRQNGWLVSNVGTILRTRDGGATWEKQESGTTRHLAAVFFIDAKTGWIISERSVLSTTDGGKNWTATQPDVPLASGTLFTDIFFIDKQEGWITTTAMASSLWEATATLLHTTDGGKNWSIAPSPPEKWLKAVIMTDNTTGWLAGSEHLYNTNDGGATWTARLDGGGDPFVDIVITGNNRLYALTFTGTIYRHPDALREEKTGIWEIGENIGYSAQCMSENLFVGAEYIYDRGLDVQNIVSVNLITGEKEVLLEFDPELYRIDTPAIDGSLLVWSQADTTSKYSDDIDWETLDYDIFAYDMETGETRRITDDDFIQGGALISGKWVVWLDYRHDTGERYPYPASRDVYAYNLETGEERRIIGASTAEGYGNLAIDGEWVVWSDNRYGDPSVKSRPGNIADYNNEIFAYNLETGEERRITDYEGNDHYPAIHENRVAWLRQTTLRGGDIMVYDFESDETVKVSGSGYASYCPSVFGERVVWTDAGISQGNTNNDVIENGVPGGADIFGYDFASGEESMLISCEREVETSSGTRVLPRVLMFPVISGDYLVYEWSRQIGPIVYATRLEK